MRNKQHPLKRLRTSSSKLGLLLAFGLVVSGCSSFQSTISNAPSGESVESQESEPLQSPKDDLTNSQSNRDLGNKEPAQADISKTSVTQPKRPPQPKQLDNTHKQRVTRSAEQAVSNVMRPAAAMTQTDAIKIPVNETTPPIKTANVIAISHQSSNTDEEASNTVTLSVPATEESTLATVEEINRLTEETPTAAGIAATDITLTTPDATAADAIAVATEETLDTAVTTQPQQLRRPNLNKIFKPKAVGIWTIEKSQEGEYAGICRVSAPTRQLSLPDYSTQLWLNIINDELIVNTSTSIDINQQGVGIKTNNRVTPFSKNLYSDTVVWSGNLAEVLNKNDQLDIVIGGQELGKKTITTSFDTKSLKSAYSAYEDCRY